MYTRLAWCLLVFAEKAALSPGEACSTGDGCDCLYGKCISGICTGEVGSIPLLAVTYKMRRLEMSHAGGVPRQTGRAWGLVVLVTGLPNGNTRHYTNSA